MLIKEATIAKALKKRAAISHNKIAYIFDGVIYTWGEIGRAVDELSQIFAGYGICKGTHVGILGTNTIEWIISYYAVQELGAVGVLLNYAYTENELVYSIEYADIEFLLVGELKQQIDHQEILSRYKHESSVLKACIDMCKYASACLYSIKNGSEYLDEISAKSSSVVSSDDAAVIIFTSGTTRRPKAVVQSQGAIMQAMYSVAERIRWKEDDRIVMPLPLYHGSGANCGLIVAMISGMSTVLIRSYHTVDILKAIQNYKCTVFNAVPAMLLLMINNPHFDDYDLSSLNSGILSGSTITQECYRRICEKLNIPHLLPAYGMTETTTLNTMADYDSAYKECGGNAGTAFQGMDIRIWDISADQEANTGETGEIQIRGYCVMKKYYRLDDLTAEAFTVDNWFKTGDVGFMDENGCLHFLSRISQLIVRGGENISPCEIEQTIEEYSDDIRQVKVVGVPDSIMQEEIAALIIAKDNKLDKEDLKAFMRKKLAYFKIPKYIFVVNDFTMTGSGKIDVKAAKQQAIDLMQTES